MTKNLKKNANLEKMRKIHVSKIFQSMTKNLMKAIDTKNLMIIMARPLECLFGWTLGKILRIILWKYQELAFLTLRQMRKTNGPLNQDLIFSPLCYNQRYSWWLIPQFIKTKAFLVPLDMINIIGFFLMTLIFGLWWENFPILGQTW